MRYKASIKLLILIILIGGWGYFVFEANAQDDINFFDGEVDSIWQNVAPFYAADTGQNPDAEILAAYVTVDSDYPTWIYFRVDFADPPESTDFTIYLDCDENDEFDDPDDRLITFTPIDGELLGFFRDSGVAESTAIIPLSEIVALQDDSFVVEIGIDLSDWSLARSFDPTENYFLETCLGTTDTSNEDPEKLIGVLIGIDFSDETEEGYFEILSAVEVNRLSVSGELEGLKPVWVGAGILIILTFSLFVWRRGTRYV